MGAKSKGLKELAYDLDNAAGSVVEQGKKVVGKGCLNIKTDARRIIKGASTQGHITDYPSKINYDVTVAGDTIRGQVGPDLSKGGQAPLGGILEDGTPHSAPIPHLAPAYDIELPRFDDQVAELGQSLVEGRKTPDGPIRDTE